MPWDGWTFFTWPVKWGERLRQLLNTARKGEEERGEGLRRRSRLSVQWDMLHFLQQLAGAAESDRGQGAWARGSTKGNWAWSLRFAPADCKISDLRSCGLRDKMQSVVDPACAPLPPSPSPTYAFIICQYIKCTIKRLKRLSSRRKSHKGQVQARLQSQSAICKSQVELEALPLSRTLSVSLSLSLHLPNS